MIDNYKRQKKYFKTEKGKEAHRKASKEYYKRNREKVMENITKYFQTEEGKAKKAEYNRRYREKKKREREMLGR